jgi:hypothetical protein
MCRDYEAVPMSHTHTPLKYHAIYSFLLAVLFDKHFYKQASYDDDDDDDDR